MAQAHDARARLRAGIKSAIWRLQAGVRAINVIRRPVSCASRRVWPRPSVQSKRRVNVGCLNTKGLASSPMHILDQHAQRVAGEVHDPVPHTYPCAPIHLPGVPSNWPHQWSVAASIVWQSSPRSGSAALTPRRSRAGTQIWQAWRRETPRQVRPSNWLQDTSQINSATLNCQLQRLIRRIHVLRR
ncbi:hypothetical protein D3C87_1394470 [compost metagenome]|jgi:hypothetical protein